MSKIIGSVADIKFLIEQALLKVLDGEEHPGVDCNFRMLTEKLNAPEFKKKSANDLKQSQIQKEMYYKLRKSFQQGKGLFGVKYTSPYLDRLCLFVHGETYTTHFGEFTGKPLSISDGIEDPPERADVKSNEFFESLHELGISGTTNKLSRSQFEPLQSMEQTKHTLFFMGLLGSKWVKDIERFRQFLIQVQSKNGRVKYLLINPTGESFNMLKTMRGEHLKDESTEKFLSLINEFSCLEVRFYDFLPVFRLIFIDNNLLALSRYKLDAKNYIKSDRGWEAPHLIIEAEKGEWSLYEPFLRYYETIWKSSTKLKDIFK